MGIHEHSDIIVIITQDMVNTVHGNKKQEIL